MLSIPWKPAMKSFRSIQFIVALICVFWASNLFAQDVVDLSGTVLGADGKPVQGVSVVLDAWNLSDTTKADGTWKIQGDIVATKPKFSAIRSMRWLGSDLVTQFDIPTLVHADLFDAAGRRLAALPSTVVGAGVQAIPLDIPRFSGARWLRVVANGKPTVLSARSGVSAPGIALPRSLAARASENILIYSLQGQIITEDKLEKLIAANLYQYIKSYAISAKMSFDPRVKVDSAWAWFTGGSMTSPLRARMAADEINQRISGTVYTVRPKDAFATYTFRTWLNIHGNGNRLTAVSDTIKFNTDFGGIEWARPFSSGNAFPDGSIVGVDSVEVGTDLDLSVAMAWRDTANHRVKDSVIKAEWDLADGKGWRLATGLPPTAKARWNSTGIDTVKLRLMDVDSNVAVIIKTIKVVNSGAALKFGGPTDTTITPSDTVAFRLTVRDTSGVARVIWSYGDGRSDTTKTGNVHAVKHAYPDYRVVGAGKDSTFALAVTVVDSLGGSSSHELARVKVVNTVLIGQLTYPAQPTWGALVNTEIPYQVSIAPANKHIAHAEWDLGDGKGWRAGIATTYQAKWLKPGSYAVKVRLTDKDSNTVVLTSNAITISNTKAAVQILSIIDSGLMHPGTMDTIVTPSDTVVFTLKMTDPNGVAKVLWDFGDGALDSTGAGATQVIRHPYPGPDVVPPNTAKRFLLSLIAIDSLGDTTKLPKFLSVRDTNDVPALIPLPDTFSYVDSTLRLTARATGLGKIVRYEWSTDGVTFGAGRADSVFKMPDTTTSVFPVYIRAVNKAGTASKFDSVNIVVFGFLLDPRDNRRYKIIRIGTQVWMAENLNYVVDSSWWYNNSADSGAKYGRLYTWASALGIVDSCNDKWCASRIASRSLGICSEGWHLPSIFEWRILTSVVSSGIDSRYSGAKLKAKISWDAYGAIPKGTDDYGFAVLAAGGREINGVYTSIFKSADFWSASEGSENASGAWNVNLNYQNEGFGGANYTPKRYGFSIRCIKD